MTDVQKNIVGAVLIHMSASKVPVTEEMISSMVDMLDKNNAMFGVAPLHIRQEDTADELFREAISSAKNAGLLKAGDKVVLTAGVPLGIPGRTNMIRVEEV